MRVGQILYGFCGGFFDSDSYDDKRIEAIGYDWIVCRSKNGEVHMGRTYDGGSIEDTLSKYLVKPEDYDPCFHDGWDDE